MTDGSAAGHLYLYGLISSESWWGDEVTPKQLLDDIKSLGDITSLTVHIFSDGGDVFAGTAIYSILKQQKASVNVYIEGIAASIATVIAMAGDQIYISRSGSMYLHNPMLGLFGYYNAGEMDAMIKELGKVREPIIAAYQAKTGKSRDEIIAIMDGEDKTGSWFTASEAIESGLATAYIPEESDTALECVACLAPNVYRWKGVTLDLSQYANAPNLPIKINKARRTITMQNKKAKSTKRTRNGVKAELVEVTCPDCGATFQWDVSQDAEASMVEVTCPECGATFDWDTDQEEANNQNATDETIEVTCPECGAAFDWDIPEGETEEEVLSVTCPECGATFDWETSQGESDPDPDNKKVDKYSAGVVAERKRITSLDSIAAAYPDAVNIIARAKQQGWSYDRASRVVFNMMARKRGGAAASENSAADAFLSGFAKDAAAAGGRVSAVPNGGHGDNGGSDEASEIAGIVDVYNKMRNGGKK